MSETDNQQQLFTQEPAPLPATTTLPAAEPTPKLQEALSVPDLLEQVFLSQCHWRRWDRELLFGACDQELGRAFGSAWCSGKSGYDLVFKSEGEPTLQVTHRLFNVEGVP